MAWTSNAMCEYNKWLRENKYMGPNKEFLYYQKNILWMTSSITCKIKLYLKCTFFKVQLDWGYLKENLLNMLTAGIRKKEFYLNS